MQRSAATAAPTGAVATAAFPIVVALSFAHMLNDMMQSLLPAIYPIIKDAHGLDFAHIGMITLAFQLTASMLQPVVGIYSDLRPRPYSTVAGMACTLVGLIILAHASTFELLLLGAALVGLGSSIFHPEATRMARLASGGRHGFAQSTFQVGGQVGQAIGPLLAAFIVVPRGQGSLSWFSVIALLAMIVLFQVGSWYRRQSPVAIKTRVQSDGNDGARRKGVSLAVAALVLLMFSKSAYSASLTNYLTFYLIDKFGVSVQMSQYLLFVFLLSQALGALIGGHVSDRLGRLRIIWFSIFGALPFTLLLPYVGLAATIALTIIIGMIMSSAFPPILVYALELLPGRVGMIAGMFYGVSFGLGALSAALLGVLADLTSLSAVYHLCSYLPAIGLLAWFLPRPESAM
jgi:FSR family fosmidomycin resistance protein-like MFS transporter